MFALEAHLRRAVDIKVLGSIAEMTDGMQSRVFTTASLVCILLLYVIAMVRLHPMNFFGLTGDDSVYFSSAQAIAQGKGYVLPSIPGMPPATKYPFLYPWILSWIWRWNSSFPGNITPAIAVTVSFGLVFLALAFFLLRRLKGITDHEALFLTAFCALQPAFLFYSGNLLSDVPFAALALAAMSMADQAMQPQAGNRGALGCGVLVGVAMLIRVFAIPVAAGIMLTAMLRRAWRQSFIFCGSVLPFLATLAWHSVFPVLPISPVTGPAASSFGWIRIWTYYTSYLGAWKLAVPNAGIFFAMLKNNGGAVLRGPGEYFIDPLFAQHVNGGATLAIWVAAAVLASVVRQSQNQQWKPIYVVLPFYTVPILFWNFADATRFFLPFLPLFAAGLWLEGKHFLGCMRTIVEGTRSMKGRMTAAALGLIILISASAISWCYKDGLRKGIAFESQYRASLLGAKQETYAWLTQNAASDARVIAWEDASTYLYTGRHALRPFMFTTEELYEPQRVQDDLAHATDVAHAIGAEYWIFAEDDFAFLWADRPASVDRRMREIEKALPLVHRSRDGRVRMYSLACVQRPNDPSCGSATRVLFPNERATPSRVASNVVSRAE
jgi:hypothetical protein